MVDEKEWYEFVYSLYKKNREIGLFNDDRKKATFMEEATVNDDLFHWHLNTVDVNGSYLLVLTHDVSSVALAFYMKDTVDCVSTTGSQLYLFTGKVFQSVYRKIHESVRRSGLYSSKGSKASFKKYGRVQVR